VTQSTEKYEQDTPPGTVRSGPASASLARRLVAGPRFAGRGASAQVVSKYGTLLVLVVMSAAFTVLFPGLFLTFANVTNILSSIAIGGVVATALTMVLASGEFDLSVASVMAFAGVLVCMLMSQWGLSIAAAIVLSLVISGVVGLVNGLLLTRVGVNSFIATLGTSTILTGLTFGMNNGLPVSTGVPDQFKELAFEKYLFLSLPVLTLVVVSALLWLFLNRTVLGQYIQAVGGNSEAARLAGINVDRCRLVAFVIASAGAGLAGILLASKLGSGSTDAGNGFLLQAFAAAFLGSVALRDGEFHIVGTLIGVLTVGVGLNGLALGGVATFWGNVFSGWLLILAVGLSTLARRLSSR